jgi:hypothetical protein
MSRRASASVGWTEEWPKTSSTRASLKLETSISVSHKDPYIIGYVRTYTTVLPVSPVQNTHTELYCNYYELRDLEKIVGQCLATAKVYT